MYILQKLSENATEVGKSTKLTCRRKASAKVAECWKWNLELQLLPACKAITLSSLGFCNIERANPECPDSTQLVAIVQ